MAVHYDAKTATPEEKEKHEKENAAKVQKYTEEGYDQNFIQYLVDEGYSADEAVAELKKSVYSKDKLEKYKSSGLSNSEILKKCAEDYRSSKDKETQKSVNNKSIDINSLGGLYSKLIGYDSEKEQQKSENSIATADLDNITEVYNYSGDRTNLDFSIKELSNVFGLPYQFDDITDPPPEGSHIGRLYMEKILTKMPLLVLTPGLPSFMAGESASKQYTMINDLINGGSKGLKEIDNSFSTHSKYYSLVFAAKEYYKYVDTLCQVLAYFLGIQDVSINFHNKNTTIADIDWGNEALFNKSLATNMSYLGGVAFYVNAESSVSESFSNSTSESVLKSKINEFSDIGREIQFVTGGLGVGPKFAQAKQVEGEQSKQDQNTSMISKFINNLASASKTIFAGGKLIFPSLWGDSDYGAPSNSVNIRLTCPDYDKVSWYLNIGVPLMHLICLAAPRQAGPNGYVSPFLVKAFYKGIFNINMGMVGSLQVSKGQEGGWTIDNLPTVVDVQLEIKDLYSKFVVSKANLVGKDSDMNNIIENTALITYLGNMAGVNFNIPDLVAAIKLWNTILKTNVQNELGASSVLYGLSDTLANIVSKVASANIFKYD